MFDKIFNRLIPVVSLMFVVGCSQKELFCVEESLNINPSPLREENVDAETLTDEYEAHTVSQQMIFEEAPNTLYEERRELMLVSEDFIRVRDEILIEILGIDGSLPVYHSYEDDPDYIKLPYGGVLTKLGKYAYRVGLYELELGFNIIPASANRLYYPDVGIEIDVLYAGDAPYDVIRYLYVSNNSTVKLPSGIGIGSKREDVVREYEQFILSEFHPMLTEEEVIALGSNLNGIYFVIRDNFVYSIYVAVIREDSIFSPWITQKNSGFDLYPDWFYPDREFISCYTVQTDVMP